MNRVEYANLVLDQLGAPIIGRRGARRMLVAWGLAESGHEPCDGRSGARFNLWNTTLLMPGSTDFNTTAHVQNYTTGTQGVQAVVDTLRGDARYAGLVTALTTRWVKAPTVADAINRSPWGTHQPLLGEALASYRGDRRYFNRLTIGAPA